MDKNKNNKQLPQADSSSHDTDFDKTPTTSVATTIVTHDGHSPLSAASLQTISDRYQLIGNINVINQL